MEKALKMKERREAIEKEVGEIKARNFEAMKEKCRVDVAKKGERMDFLRRFHEERREALQEENINRIENSGKVLHEKIDDSQKIAEEILSQKSKVPYSTYLYAGKVGIFMQLKDLCNDAVRRGEGGHTPVYN